ncbi:3-phosphoshikimate 1-carboxyvinyltransferase [Candidatus Desantisbacteria bacterium]|nr:3-phosphoshikimate 1-carboxyvinyltransferase [Candidatus Desantisbacteria bacterium]
MNSKLKINSTLKIKPINYFKGETEVQGDKSISHRAILLGGLLEGSITINNFLESEDTLNTARAYQKMGIEIKGLETKNVTIKGKGLNGLIEPDGILDLGNSGTSMRLLLGILSGQNFYSVVTGDKSLCRRPMQRVTIPLKKMGALIYGREKANFAPLTIIGKKLNGINFKSNVSSAQVKSCLILAGLFAKGTTVVTEPILSRDHTERMLAYFGANIKKKNILTTSITSKKKLLAKDIFVPGDISSAAYFIIGALILKNSKVTIKNVGINPTRTGILDILKNMGAKITLTNYRNINDEPVADITACSSKLNGTEISGDIIPRLIDEIPIIAIAAACADGETIIKNAGELRVKESDRIKTVTNGLTTLGIKVKELPDGMIIRGGMFSAGNKKFNSYGDHRIAMSFAIAGLKIQGGIVINDTDCINTSFPEFTNILKNLSY